jgi:hypothetical protein
MHRCTSSDYVSLRFSLLSLAYLDVYSQAMYTLHVRLTSLWIEIVVFSNRKQRIRLRMTAALSVFYGLCHLVNDLLNPF